MIKPTREIGANVEVNEARAHEPVESSCLPLVIALAKSLAAAPPPTSGASAT